MRQLWHLSFKVEANVCFKKKRYTFATLYSSKCVTVFFETDVTYSWQFSSHTVVGLVGTISSPLDKLRSEISWKKAELIVVTVKEKKVHLYCGCEVLNLLLTKVTTYKKVCLSGRINDVLDCFVFWSGFSALCKK